MSEIGGYRLLSLKYYYHDNVTSLPCQLITGYDLCTNHSRHIISNQDYKLYSYLMRRKFGKNFANSWSSVCSRISRSGHIACSMIYFLSSRIYQKYIYINNNYIGEM